MFGTHVVVVESASVEEPTYLREHGVTGLSAPCLARVSNAVIHGVVISGNRLGRLSPSVKDNLGEWTARKFVAEMECAAVASLVS